MKGKRRRNRHQTHRIRIGAPKGWSQPVVQPKKPARILRPKEPEGDTFSNARQAQAKLRAFEDSRLGYASYV